MTPELEQTIQRLADIEDIKQLKARYASACDDDYNPDKLAPLFAEDAIWDGSIMGHAEGREGIREFFAAASSLVPFAVHQVSNPLIEIEPMVLGEQALWLSAVYEDQYVRVDGQWLYQHLKLNIRMLTPYEEGPAKTRIIEMDV
jgi:hypothetical protein